MGRQATYEIPNYSGTELCANMKREEARRIIDRETTVDAANLLLNATTVDTVEVVRCKDCIRWDSETGWCDKHSRFYHGGLDWAMFNDDDFCSCGERRTDG